MRILCSHSVTSNYFGEHSVYVPQFDHREYYNTLIGVFFLGGGGENGVFTLSLHCDHLHYIHTVYGCTHHSGTLGI